MSSPLVTELDVRDDAAIDGVFGRVSEVFEGELDLLVHSVAFAAAEASKGASRIRRASAFGWRRHERVLARRDRTGRRAAMEAAGGGSIVTMTYLGGERAVPHYNVMGVAKATLDSSVQYLAWDLARRTSA